MLGPWSHPGERARKGPGKPRDGGDMSWPLRADRLSRVESGEKAVRVEGAPLGLEGRNHGEEGGS